MKKNKIKEIRKEIKADIKETKKTTPFLKTITFQVFAINSSEIVEEVAGITKAVDENNEVTKQLVTSTEMFVNL